MDDQEGPGTSSADYHPEPAETRTINTSDFPIPEDPPPEAPVEPEDDGSIKTSDGGTPVPLEPSYTQEEMHAMYLEWIKDHPEDAAREADSKDQ